jgi:hypothetical protein
VDARAVTDQPPVANKMVIRALPGVPKMMNAPSPVAPILHILAMDKESARIVKQIAIIVRLLPQIVSEASVKMNL